MKAAELRDAFTGFFADRDHTRLESGSLIPHDPTVLFTVAGMVPLKPYFTGEEPPPAPRAVTVQKCVRAGGKHNDLDEIGRSLRHLTFFEMMGNFSFGDYFKERAIPLAWEFVTEVLGLDPERLWVTVHLSDDEAEEIWRDTVGVPADRIQRLDEDNFWDMGPTGPCGPCSEIFWDKGPEFGEDGGPEHGGEERFVEIWNLVFMQFEQLESGERVPLPKPSIDTGAGLERIVSVLQGVDSVFDIDEMQSLLTTAQELTGVTYGEDESSDVSLRILAEHARTMTFLISDGVFPSNENRGYVLRRIMRRAVRHAYLLGVTAVVTPGLVDQVVDLMGGHYPDLVKNHDFIRNVVEREEERFRQTLATGSQILDTELEKVGEGDQLAGDVAFQLHDTYGFPLEVTMEIASERGVEVDSAGFDAAMDEQRTRAKAARAKVSGTDNLELYQALLAEHGPTNFVGRDLSESQATVLAVVPVPADAASSDEAADASSDESDNGDASSSVAATHDIILDTTPFYAESGGQIGDTGSIVTETGTAAVVDTTYGVPGMVRHRVHIVDGVIDEGQSARASIDAGRRSSIKRNHTATHLLHHALREVLGDHVTQQGSYVGPGRLRFDFSHYEAMTPEEIAAVEDQVNAEVLSNPEARHFETSKDEAEALGALAFFGDKYGDRVMVLQAGPNSIEFCGGTHVSALGDIGMMKIVSEGSVGSNIRRVEAVTGTDTVELLRRDAASLRQAAEIINVPADELIEGLNKRQVELKELRDELAALKRDMATSGADDLIAQAVDGIVIARADGLERDALRDLALAVRDHNTIRAVILGGAPAGGGAALVAAVTTDGDLHAGELIAGAAKAIKGGGGKDPHLVMAGGKDPEGLDEALNIVRSAVGLG
jgi:alanyl-tRNA synthetase